LFFFFNELFDCIDYFDGEEDKADNGGREVVLLQLLHEEVHNIEGIHLVVLDARDEGSTLIGWGQHIAAAFDEFHETIVEFGGSYPVSFP